MKKILVSAAFAAAIFAPSAAIAQTVPAAIIAVVDLDKVTGSCNACRTASAALQSQVAALKSHQQSLATPLQAEEKSIQTAIDALGGKAPDAALKARVQAFQNKQQADAQTLTREEDTIRRNQTYIQQQITSKLGPIYQQVMQRRGANVMVEISNTLASSANLDVSNDVLAALNASLPTIQTTAPAGAAQPDGR
jgi:Skp family chaperone for outer membrane proteins